VVEDSRRVGKSCGPFNSYFITNIPMECNPPYFESYKSISLYNNIYKNHSWRLKPILSIFIANEQVGFLNGGLIFYDVGVSQEALHFIKKKSRLLRILKREVHIKGIKVSRVDTITHLLYLILFGNDFGREDRVLDKMLTFFFSH
jgi:hypothetical protein